MENSGKAEVPGGRRRARRLGPVRWPRRRTILGAAAVALFICALVVGVGLAIPQSTAPGGSAVQETATAQAVAPPSVPQTAVSPVPVAAPVRLAYASLGVDMPIRTLTPTPQELAQRSLDPPLTKDAYWLSNYGRPGSGSTDTTFIISHRWIGEDAPFNRIGSGARPGDHFLVQTQAGTLEYAVDSVTDYDKATLFASPIWAAVPNRVVMITCDLDDPWGKNTVVTAEPVRK